MTCRNHRALMLWQRDRFLEEVDVTKWIMSFHAHYDVGLQAAIQEFQLLHLRRCAVCWRNRFCGSECEFRLGCELGAAIRRKDSKEIR